MPKTISDFVFIGLGARLFLEENCDWIESALLWDDSGVLKDRTPDEKKILYALLHIFGNGGRAFQDVEPVGYYVFGNVVDPDTGRSLRIATNRVVDFGFEMNAFAPKTVPWGDSFSPRVSAHGRPYVVTASGTKYYLSNPLCFSQEALEQNYRLMMATTLK